jgi:CDP-diglyceride synthetase
MTSKVDFKIIDLAVFIMANLVNLLLVGIFLSRPRGLDKAEYMLGLIMVALILPVGFAVLLNALRKREWWTIVLPLLLIVFLVIELLFDYILKLDFRSTALLWPYLLVFYAALMAMVGYSFLVKKSFGYVTLCTYFLSLLATWYSYAKVGHG